MNYYIVLYFVNMLNTIFKITKIHCLIINIYFNNYNLFYKINSILKAFE